MQYVADLALEKHGAEDEKEQAEEAEPLVESTYVVELPTLTVDESLSRAVDLGLRPDPDRLPQGFAAATCEKASTLLRGPKDAPEDASNWERFADWADRSCHSCLPILTWRAARAAEVRRRFPASREKRRRHNAVVPHGSSEDESRHRRGWDLDSPRTGRGDAAGAARIVGRRVAAPPRLGPG